MTYSQAISDATLRVNNQTIPYEPNTLDITAGYGTRGLTSQTVGGGQTVNVYSEDSSTKVAKVKFALASNIYNQKVVKDWIFNRNNNTLKITDKTTGEALTFTNAAVSSDLEFQIGFQKQISVEFDADPML